MTGMTKPSSSAARSKTVRAASPGKFPAPAAGKAAARKPGIGPASTNGRSQVAEMLREIQIDGKALSLQIERLRERFL
jgi:hypothetical protein